MDGKKSARRLDGDGFDALQALNFDFEMGDGLNQPIQADVGVLGGKCFAIFEAVEMGDVGGGLGPGKRFAQLPVIAIQRL